MRPATYVRSIFTLAVVASALAAPQAPAAPWLPDDGAGHYRNPVIFADYSDPDVVRVGSDFYLVSSSFNATPALPILHSKDLVNWTIVGHAAPRLSSPRYDVPQHGMGVWAPSLRFHDGRFWIYFGDPDLGIFMTTARDPRGPWEPLTLVHEARGWIDPCPLWDDDGRVYLVHAWAKSRAGFNGVLTLRHLTPDGRRLLDDTAETVFDGGAKHPTIEGPKFYKRHGYYYIFAPAGGVTDGWQTVLRSKNVSGPYDDRVVLARERTSVNGPHQGAWVDTPDGTSWFVHFQDRGAYGRVVHLQPLNWRDDDWPVIGADSDGDGTGEPVETFRKPVSIPGSRPIGPQTSDEFNEAALGLQWQWQANAAAAWWSLTAHPGALRLVTQPLPSEGNLWNAPYLLLQKLPAESFEATASVRLEAMAPGAAIALVAFGLDYGLVRLTRIDRGWQIEQVVCHDASNGAAEAIVGSIASGNPTAQLRLTVADGVAQFSASADGARFARVGDRFTLRPGRWVGAKFGLAATRPVGPAAGAYADVDWIRVR